MDLAWVAKRMYGKEAEHIEHPDPATHSSLSVLPGSHAKPIRGSKFFQRRFLKKGPVLEQPGTTKTAQPAYWSVMFLKFASLPLVSRITVVIS